MNGKGKHVKEAHPTKQNQKDVWMVIGSAKAGNKLEHPEKYRNTYPNFATPSFPNVSGKL